MKNSDAPFISVIIPSYNSFRTIGKTIQGIQAQKSYHDIKEIIVVDSSDDGLTRNFLNRCDISSLRTIRSGVKVMPGLQRNIGAEESKGDLLVFTDSDTIPETDWLCQIKKAYFNGTMIGGGSYLMDKSQLQNPMVVAEYYLELGEYIPKGKPRRKRVIPSGNMFCDRELFFKVDGFPQIRASEDSLFCLNVSEHSPVYFIPDATLIHMFRENKPSSLSNLILMGKYLIIYRKIYYQGLFMNKAFLFTLFPFIVIYKFTKVYFRALFSGWRHFMRINKALPQFLLCAKYWSLGIWKGIFEEENLENYAKKKYSKNSKVSWL